jgi:glutathione S-transferase
MMKLYYYPGACSLVVHIAMEEIGVPYEAIKIDFASDQQKSAEYLAINPAGCVPALQVERGCITEIPAILAYLAKTFPTSGLMVCDDAFTFAEMQAFHMHIATRIHVLFRQISGPHYYADGDIAHTALKAKVPEMSDTYFAPIENRISDGRQWVHGDTFSASDIYLYVFSSYLNMKDRGNPDKIPFIWKHRQRVRQRPATQRALDQETSELVALTLFD